MFKVNFNKNGIPSPLVACTEGEVPSLTNGWSVLTEIPERGVPFTLIMEEGETPKMYVFNATYVNYKMLGRLAQFVDEEDFHTRAAFTKWYEYRFGEAPSFGVDVIDDTTFVDLYCPKMGTDEPFVGRGVDEGEAAVYCIKKALKYYWEHVNPYEGQ